jgi:hypothetical protein
MSDSDKYKDYRILRRDAWNHDRGRGFLWYAANLPTYETRTWLDPVEEDLSAMLCTFIRDIRVSSFVVDESKR